MGQELLIQKEPAGLPGGRNSVLGWETARVG